MADSVRERIMQHLQTSLQGITVANGFATTLNRVERFLQRGQSIQPPMAILLEGSDDPQAGVPLSGAYGLISRVLTVQVGLIVQQDDDTDARSASAVMNALVADVQKKLQEDVSRGGVAVNTEEAGVSELDVDEGMTQLRCVVSYRVAYRHSRIDPAIAG